MNVAHAVQQSARLMRERLNDARIAVPGGGDPESSAQIDIDVAVDVHEIRAGAALEGDGKVGRDVGDVAALDFPQALGQFAAARAGRLDHDVGQVLSGEFLHEPSASQKSKTVGR